MSTAETRAAGREMLKPYTRAAWIFNFTVWGLLAFGFAYVKITTGHY